MVLRYGSQVRVVLFSGVRRGSPYYGCHYYFCLSKKACGLLVIMKQLKWEGQHDGERLGAALS